MPNLTPHLLPFALMMALLVAPSTLFAQAAGSLDRLVSQLEKKDGEAFWSTVTRLEDVGRPAQDTLREALDAPGEKTRLGCAKALLQVGDARARKAALRVIEELAGASQSKTVRIDAILIFGALGDPDRALEILTPLLETSLDPELLVPVAKTVWEIDHVRAGRDKLVLLLESRDADVRADAALALAEIGYYEGDVRNLLRSLKKEPTSRGRRAALLDELMRLSRELDRRFDERGVVGDTDFEELLRIKEERIRKLETEIESKGRGPSRPSTPEDRLLEEVIALVKSRYVSADKTSREQLLLGAVEGLLSRLDPHSSFQDAAEKQEFLEHLDGNYHGIGANVTKLEGQPLEIAQPIYSGPSYRAGVRSGDTVVSIDEQATADLDMNELMKLLKGPAGSEVTLEVERRGEEESREIVVKRAAIEVPSVYFARLPERLGAIRLSTFGARSANEFEAALESLEKDGLDGLIIDFRGNGGGRLEIAIRLADLFLDDSQGLPIVSKKGRSGQSESTHPTPGARGDYPIVVLVNEHSASASEIVAGALKEFGRASLVGVRTYGKGSVQELIRLNSRKGAQVKLTTQYYYLPLGRCIDTIRDADGNVLEKGGIDPDVIVRQPTIPGWRFEERRKNRRAEAILEYVDRHFDTLRGLVPLGDRGDSSAYPEIETLDERIDSPLPNEDLRALVLAETRLRVEDERGRRFGFVLQEDRQLQVGVRTLLDLLGREASASEAYGWIRPPEETSPVESDSPDESDATTPPETESDDP